MLNTEKTIGRIKSNVKTIATLTVGLGVGEIVASAVREYKTDVKGLNKLFIKLGAVAMTGMIVSMVNKYVEEQIDEVFDEGQKMYERLNILAAQKEKNEDSEDTEDATDDTKVCDIEDHKHLAIPFFKTQEDAIDMCKQFKDALNKFGVLTEAQAKVLIGIEPSENDSHWGWKDLKGIKILSETDGCSILMPRMVWLN